MYILFLNYESKIADREVWVALDDIQPAAWFGLVAAVQYTPTPVFPLNPFAPSTKCCWAEKKHVH